ECKHSQHLTNESHRPVRGRSPSWAKTKDGLGTAWATKPSPEKEQQCVGLWCVALASSPSWASVSLRLSCPAAIVTRAARASHRTRPPVPPPPPPPRPPRRKRSPR